MCLIYMYKLFGVFFQVVSLFTSFFAGSNSHKISALNKQQIPTLYTIQSCNSGYRLVPIGEGPELFCTPLYSINVVHG